ncbi:MAG: hydrogenase iron-sulfur subunit [Desulfobacterales bacterium]|jgi:coenzyme F420-reducing hydrogenase delta subunit|nr:hydrogenase iron-sulfur subunit [Desulfobacterales bacterium]
MRLNYPASVKIIRVPCTGKVDVIHMLRAFEKGADGVYIVGCKEGECHYKKGNYRARKRVEQAQKILNTIGVGGDRVQMYNLSSSDAPLFVKYANEMNERIMGLGPNPVKLKKKKAA